MKIMFKLIGIVALWAGAWGASAGERSVQPLGGAGWKLWLDRDAAFKDDVLAINAVDSAKVMSGAADWLKPVDARSRQVVPPTCGWDALFAKPVDWARAEEAWKDRSLCLEVSVPGTVEEYFFDAISGDRRGDRTSGDYRGVSWWGRSFKVPSSAKGRRVTLVFREGVRHRAEVLVNRRSVGYELVLQSPFELDITDVVTYGGVNELAVRITDPCGSFSWGDYVFDRWGRYMLPASHGFGGILGGVDVVTTDRVRVDDVFVCNRPEPRAIDTAVEIGNASDVGRTVKVEAEVVENWADNAPVAKPRTIFAKDVGSVTIPPGSTRRVDFSATVKEARLWDIGEANLYDMRITLRDERGGLVDRYSARFGFRFLEPRGIGSNAQFFLNGRRVFLLSAISWGYWPANGMIPTPELARRHVESAKKLGMNMINFHRYRGNDAVLNAADEMGVLYYEEPGGFSSYRFKDQDMTEVDQSVAFEICRQKLLRMVKNHRNHASLAIYNMVNEPGWSPDERAKRAMAEAHALDPSRFICYGSGFMGPRNDEPQKLHMLPFDDRQYTVGYCDIHNAGNSPGVYVDANWNSPASFLRDERDEKELFVWGEEGALATPPQVELIHEEKLGRPNGWDGQQYDLWYEGYRGYIERKGLKKNFPSVTKLITSLGDVMYYEHGRILENVRIADGAEIYVLNGYEDMKDDNLSGCVDCYRNPKGTPSLIADYMKPLMVAVKAREKLGEVGDVKGLDLYVLNEYVLKAGSYNLKAQVKTPTGKVRTLHAATVEVTGGETFSDCAATGLKVALDDGPGYYRITSELLGPDGRLLATGHDEMFAVEYRGVKIAAKSAVVGGGSEYIRFAKDVLGAEMVRYEAGLGRLDCILLAPTDQGKTFLPVPSFNFRAPDGKTMGLQLEHYRGTKFGQRLDRRITTAAIDFNVKSKLIPGYDIIGTSDFSVRWEGFLFSDYTGDVEFEYTCDDGARVWFDGECVVDKWSNGPKAVRNFTRRMVAGEKHAIKIEAFQAGGDWLASLKWKLPVPETKVDLQDILRRVREDGTTLVLVEGAEDWLKKLREADAFPAYRVFHPHKTWVGHNLFVKDHPIFAGLPVDCAMNWEYQRLAVYDGPKHFGLEMEGEEPLVGLVGVPLRGVATSVGIVPCGKGRILFSSLDLAPNLASDSPAAVTPKRIFANILKWASDR